jgi:hypothetical protein
VLAEQEEDLASSAEKNERMAEQAAGPSSGEAHDTAVQRTAATDDVAGASVETSRKKQLF